MMSMKITFFWDVVLCNLVEISRTFGGTRGLHASAVSCVQHSSRAKLRQRELIFCFPLAEQYYVTVN
jgi:hypothetical protein